MNRHRGECDPNTKSEALLNEEYDPSPVRQLNPASTFPLLLVCEHAGHAVPKTLDNLGLSEHQLEMHIAYDIGADNVATGLADRFGCSLISQRYSRLVIDCNRPPGSKTSIPEVSDRTRIPGNRYLSAGDRERRERSVFSPFAECCKTAIAKTSVQLAISIHSFTPCMNGISRPWDVGFLFRHPSSFGDKLADLSEALWPDLMVGHNQPYSIEDDTDWFIPMCAEPRGIPHCLIEIRNDHLHNGVACRDWVNRLHRLISAFMEQE